MPFIGQTISPLSSPDLLKRDVPCDSSVTVGKWVRFDNTNILILAQADNMTNSNVIGLVEEKTSPNTCSIRVGGISGELFISLDTQLNYFLSPTIPGEMTTVIPVGSGEVVLNLGQAFSDKKFLVEKKIRLRRA